MSRDKYEPVPPNAVNGPKLKAWWFNPRTGKADAIGEFEAKGDHKFNTPDPGEASDWILVLDDASKNYPPPRESPR